MKYCARTEILRAYSEATGSLALYRDVPKYLRVKAGAIFQKRRFRPADAEQFLWQTLCLHGNADQY
jgi:hypothetical protein